MCRTRGEFRSTLLSVCDTGSQSVSVSPLVWAIRITPGAEAFSTPDAPPTDVDEDLEEVGEPVPIAAVSGDGARSAGHG